MRWLLSLTPIFQQLLIKLLVEMLSHTTSLWYKLQLVSNQGLISISRDLAFNFVQQFVLLRLHSSVVLCIKNLDPTAASLEEFTNFPFLDNDNIIANLARELPDYLASADGVVKANEEEKLAWWAAHSDTLPHWAVVVKKLLVISTMMSIANIVMFTHWKRH